MLQRDDTLDQGSSMFATSDVSRLTGTKRIVTKRGGPTTRDAILKRGFDILVSTILIAILAPVLIVVALLVKFTSTGPALYSNERVGYRGRRFRCSSSGR